MLLALALALRTGKAFGPNCQLWCFHVSCDNGVACMASHGWWVSVMGPSLSSDQAPQRFPYKKNPKQEMWFFLGFTIFFFFFKKWDCGNGIIEIMGHGLSESNLLLTKVIRSLQRFIRKREKERVGGPELGGCQNHAASGPQSLRWSRV